MKKTVIYGWISFHLVFTIMMMSCDNGNGGTGPEEIPENVSFNLHVQSIFSANCATGSCHTNASRSGNLSLAAGSSYDNIVDQFSSQQTSELLIKPGVPNESYLYKKILGEGISGQRMPFGRSPLSDVQIGTIEKWILDDAPRN